MRASTFRRLVNLWPPFLVNAIRLQSLSENYSKAEGALSIARGSGFIPTDSPCLSG